ncbi:MAG: diguanylate cyclase [Gammaproteobacteria bacterium]|nr:diguanylate cyclase [Gammaproteobacteria bacterium]MBU1646901.1 diguanylate cyclase [Gammaproteobacteria bacterium]MBU1971162.1 diguanylate cyclase [Gammaproteobacteria bacterium]
MKIDVGRHLGRRFFAAMLLVVAIAAADFLVVDYHTRTASRDAEITNLAGRQRMLAARIASLVNHLALPEMQAEMDETVARMRDGFQRLTQPDGGYLDAAAVRELCLGGDRPVRPRVAEYLAAAERGDVELITAMYKPLAADIDRSVTAYAEFATHRIRVLRTIEAATFATQLLVLWLIWRFIFRPMAQRIDRDFRALDASRTRTRAILDAAGEGICGIDNVGCIIFINDKACHLLGCAKDDALGANLHDLAHHHDAAGTMVPAESCSVLRAAQDGSQQRLQLDAFWRQDGSRFPVEVVVAPLRSLEGFVGAVIVFSDISERKQAEACYELSSNVLNTIAEGVFITTPDGTITRTNPAFSVVTGYQPDEAIGQTPRILKSGRHDAAEYRAMWEAIARRGFWNGEIWNKRKSGEIFCASQSIAAIRDGRGEVTHYVAVFKDVTDHKANEDAIRRQAYHDHLTGLPNRNLFMDRLKLAIAQARRKERRMAVMFVDLDHFKEINDRLGHAVGDVVLCEASRRLRDALREGDTVARLGGDEFIVLLADLSDSPDAATVAAKMLERMAQPFDLPEDSARLGASIGIALFPQNGDDADTLIQAADAAMYVVKAEGRNGYRFA